MALGFMFNVFRRDAMPPGALEALEDFGKHRVLALLCFFEIACMQTTLNRPLTEYFTHIRGNINAGIPAIAAAIFAASPFQVGRVCQWVLPHNWHPLLNVLPY
jgi:hypothetical protein